MPCVDCLGIKAELTSHNSLLSQWFDSFYKQIESLESKLEKSSSRMEVFRQEMVDRFEMLQATVLDSNNRKEEERERGAEGTEERKLPHFVQSQDGLNSDFQEAEDPKEETPGKVLQEGSEPVSGEVTGDSGEDSGIMGILNADGGHGIFKREENEGGPMSTFRMSSLYLDGLRSVSPFGFEIGRRKRKRRKADLSTEYNKEEEGSSSPKSATMPCSECGKEVIKNLDCFQKHASIHLGLKPFTCPICGKAELRRTVLFCHVKQHHKELNIAREELVPNMDWDEYRFLLRDRTTACFPDMPKLDLTPQEKRRCTVCSKMVITESRTVRNHVAVHLDIRPLKCPYCDKTAFGIWKGNLMRHIKLVHKGAELIEPEWTMDKEVYESLLRGKTKECFEQDY